MVHCCTFNILFDTCPECGSQDFTIRMLSPYQRNLDILECNGWGCGRLFIRAELLKEPIKILKELARPICPKVVFYGDHAKDWMKFHFQIAHPTIKLKVVRKKDDGREIK